MSENERIVREPANLPCVGVFETRDGKIAEWRDYFDMASYTRAVS